MEFDSHEHEINSSENIKEKPSIPLSDYANKLDQKIKKRYLEKISKIGIDPVLIDGKNFEPDCLPPVESTDLLFYLVLETSYYTKQQFKAFRSLQAYNQMVSGFISSVQGHMIQDKFVVLAKVRHSQRMNESLIPVWIITEKQGTIISAHCCGCKAGLGESCSHVASVLFYLEAWTKINGKLSCTQVKCSWILPSYVKEVEYARVRDIKFTSAKKMKADLDSVLDRLSPIPEVDDHVNEPKNETPASVMSVPAPSEEEMDSLYAELNGCKFKPIALSLVAPFAESFVLKSRTIPTVPDLSDPHYQDLEYPELLQVCSEKQINISEDEMVQIEKDTRSQSQGANFFKHRAGRIGASQSKQASHTDPALPSQSLIQSICYPELNKLFSKAILHGCEHEGLAISAYEQAMKEKHLNFKVEKCGVFINKEYPWLHATPDFLCSCDCCGEGCGEVKCPLCIENCDFENYLTKTSSCLRKNNSGEFCIKKDHAYYYQTQQQLFTVKRNYCDFVVCAFDGCGTAKFFNQRILPDQEHWNSVLPKLTKFWRTCILPEVLGKWYTRKHFMTANETDKQPERGSTCYCRANTQDEKTVVCCNPACPIVSFHLSCLKIESVPKTWYCPTCRTLPQFKRSRKAASQILNSKQNSGVSHPAMSLDCICICHSKPVKSEKLLQCHNATCKNGGFFHLNCLNYKRMPNNSQTTWVCPACRKKVKVTHTNDDDEDDDDDVTFIKTLNTQTEKHKSLGSLGQNEFDLVLLPTGWLDCTIIHEAQILLGAVNKSIKGFQRPTLGPVRQFDIVSSDFVQLLHVNNNHWVCVSSINCTSGYVNLMDSLSNSVISQEITQLVENLLGPRYKGINQLPVQQQQNGSDCGVFAIAFATCLVYGRNPSQAHFDIPRMRPHLLKCLKARSIELFPTI